MLTWSHNVKTKQQVQSYCLCLSSVTNAVYKPTVWLHLFIYSESKDFDMINILQRFKIHKHLLTMLVDAKSQDSLICFTINYGRVANTVWSCVVRVHVNADECSSNFNGSIQFYKYKPGSHKRHNSLSTQKQIQEINWSVGGGGGVLQKQAHTGSLWIQSHSTGRYLYQSKTVAFFEIQKSAQLTYGTDQIILLCVG